MASVTLASPCLNSNLSHTPITFEINSSNPRDDDFSSYFSLIKDKFPPELGNSSLKPSSFQISLGRKRNEDREIDIFSAEKYFSGGMDGGGGGSEITTATERGGKQLYMKEGEAGARPRSGTGSTCSESSGNGQSSLLRDRRRFSASAKQSHAKGKGFLGVFRCSCSGKNSVEVDKDVAEDSSSSNSKKIDRPGGEFRCNGETGSRKIDGMGFGLKREEELPFPNSNPAAVKMTVGRDFGSPLLARDDLGSARARSLSLLSSAVVVGGGGAREDDLASESSSDLFEIESLAISSQPFSRVEGRDSSATCYEPSEASIEWSVVTASAANFSVASDYNNDCNETKKPSRQHRPGLLLGCVSEKAVEAIPSSDRREELRTESPLPPVARYHAESCRVMDMESSRAARGLAQCALPRARASRALYTH